MQIEIVAYDHRAIDIMIGFRQGKAVVYSSVPYGLDDTEAKQRGYIQVRKALLYEQTLNSPTIDGSNFEVMEVFIPAIPIVRQIILTGQTNIIFEDNSKTKTIEFSAVAIDQYGDIIDMTCEWLGAENGILTVNNFDKSYTVSAKIGDVSSSILVDVYAYSEPLVDYEKLSLYEAIAGLEERIALIEGKS